MAREYKDSGIDWIGEIPEHWEIVRLKALGGLQNGISQSGDYFGEDFEYPFISYSDVYKNIEMLKNLFVLIPSYSEQQSIASYLDTKCAEIDALIAIKQTKIDELKEYKKSVKYEYVTGKKEVV